MSERRVPQQTRGVAKRNAILAVAKDVIRRVGRDEFTTAMIAEQGGFAIGTVYAYFANRIAILDALYPNRIEGLTGPAARDLCAAVDPVIRTAGYCYRIKHHQGNHKNRAGHSWPNAEDDNQLEIP